MHKIFAAALLLVVGFVVAPTASAGVVSLLTGQNTTNDNVADDSLGFIVDATSDGGTPAAGDVAWGIAEVDKVNGVSVLGTAYIVYSAQLGVASSGVTPHSQTTVSAYSLDTLLNTGTALAGTGSIAAVIEWNGIGTNPFLSETYYPFGPGSFTGNTITQVKTDLSTLMSNSSVLFAVGLKDSVDFFNTTISGVDPTTGNVGLSLSAGLSITYVGTPLVASGFKPLIGSPSYEASVVYGATQVLKSPGTYSAAGGSISTYDQGNYNVNYVPEPSSLIALVGLGIVGIGAFARRRQQRS